ncbi:type II secretion system protein, partial [Clostridium cadaveris]
MKKGFTLIETLIVIGILGMISGVTVTFYLGALKIYDNKKCDFVALE